MNSEKYYAALILSYYSSLQNLKSQLPRMYSALQHPCRNLPYSQRFSNSIYQYYNDYQKPSDYDEDMTKLFYHSRKKTHSTLIVRGPTKNDTESRAIEAEDGRQLTMEDLLMPFAQIFDTNNFSDFRGELEQNKNKHTITFYPLQRYLKMQRSSNQNKTGTSRQSSTLQFLSSMLKIIKERIAYIMNLSNSDQIQISDMPFYEHWLAYEQMAQYQIELVTKDSNTQTGKEEASKKIVNNTFNGQNSFKNLIEGVLDDITDSTSWSHLILYIPKIAILPYFVNPLMNGVYSFLKKQESLSRSEYIKSDQPERQIPKIVFINLEGRQSPLNIRSIIMKENYSIGLLYITMYLERGNRQGEEGRDDRQSEEMDYTMSKLIIRQADEINKIWAGLKKTKYPNLANQKKILAFPLNSPYVKRQLDQKHNLDNESTNTLRGTSQDILFLFDNILYEQIRNFSPHAIIIAYNGRLHISQDHFTAIIRTLSVIADHKVVLWPNLGDFFSGETKGIPPPTPEDIEKFEMNEENIEKVRYYLEDYHRLQYKDINFATFFNNLGLFLKITTGAYSFQPRPQSPANIFPQKYQTGLRYEYLEHLALLPQFKYYSKFISSILRGGSLNQLMEKQRRDCIEKNKEGISWYDRLLRQAVDQFQEDDEESEEGLPKAIRYKLRWLKRQFQSPNKYIDYLTVRRQRLLIETIKAQKIKKAYYVRPSTTPPDDLYMFQFREDSPSHDEIFLEPYSQVIFWDQDNRNLNIFIINVRNQKDQLIGMCGRARNQSCQVLMNEIGKGSTISIEETEEQQSTSILEYVCYSYTIFKNMILLFWPYEWSLKRQAQHQILDLPYNPSLVHKFMRITFEYETNPKGKLIAWSDQLRVLSNQYILPKLFAGSIGINDSEIYVFGGVYKGENDWGRIGSGVYKFELKNTDIAIYQFPKQLHATKIRPKMHYVVDILNPTTLLISGGYGLEHSNFFNMFSFHSYHFHIPTATVTLFKTERKVIPLPIPAFTRKEGKFEMIKDTGSKGNRAVVEERQSKGCGKYKFVMCRKGFYSEQQESRGEGVAFLDDQYTTTVYNQQSSLRHLFGQTKTFQSIFSYRTCSPELYVWDSNKDLIRVQLFLQVLKQNREYWLKEYIFPNEDSLLASCLDPTHERLFMLARSPVYTESGYVVYEGALNEIEVVLQQKKLKMKVFFQMKSSLEGGMEEKTMFSEEVKIVVCGGRVNKYGVREDYVIEKIRGKSKLKTLKLTHHPNPSILEMPYSYIVESSPQYYHLYSILSASASSYNLKIQTFSLQTHHRQLNRCQLHFYSIWEDKIWKIKHGGGRLRFVGVMRYVKFSGEVVRRKAQALLIEFNKLQEQEELSQEEEKIRDKTLKKLIYSSDGQIIQNLSHYYWSFKLHLTFLLSYSGSPPVHHLQQLLITEEILTLLINARIEQALESDQFGAYQPKSDKQMYKFMVEGEGRSGIRYVGLGQLGNTKLRLFRIKYRKQIAVNISNRPKFDEKMGASLSQYYHNEIYFDKPPDSLNKEQISAWPPIHQQRFQITTQQFSQSTKNYAS